MSCPSCFMLGSLDEGTPRGVEAQLGGADVYLVEPHDGASRNGAGVIVAPDAMGWRTINTRLIADAFAGAGYVVAVPDYFGADVPSVALAEWMERAITRPSWLGRLLGHVQVVFVYLTRLVPWLLRHPQRPAAQLVARVAAALRQQHGVDKVGVQGYCYGGKVAALLAAQPDVVQAASAAHPGILMVPADVAPICVPFLLVCAGSDLMLPERTIRAAEAILAAKPGLLHKVLRYPGTIHGFAVRGNRSDAAVDAARTDALQQALAFFERALLGGGATTPRPSGARA